MSQIEMIISKLPNEVKANFNSEFCAQQNWSPEWDKWAKNLLLQCNQARDNNQITKLEWQILYNKFFKKLGGIIGEMPHSNNLDFMDFLNYNEK